MQVAVIAPQDIAPVPPQRIEELVDRYILSQDVKASSRLLYKRTLKQYLSWVASKGYQLSEVARPQILEYKEDLLLSHKSSLTTASYLTSVRSFYEWTEANKYYPNVAKGVRAPKRRQLYRRQPLQTEQAKDLLSYYQDKALRDYAVATLLLKTGLRTIEVSRANVGDIVFKGSHRVLLVQGKGKDEKDNWVKLTDKTYSPIADYLATRPGASADEPLFTSTSNNSKGDRLTTRTISCIVKEGLKAIGLDTRAYTAHSLRHTGATEILRNGGSLEDVRLFCRHSNPATTLIYVATIDEERRLKNSGEDILDSLY